MFNGASYRTSDLDYTPYVYDHLARCGQRMVVVCGDDNHSTVQSCIAWTMIKADKLTYTDLIDGLEKGNCYASDGPEIYDLYTEVIDGQRYVHISCSGAKGIYLTTAGRIASFPKTMTRPLMKQLSRSNLRMHFSVSRYATSAETTQTQDSIISMNLLINLNY
jgi:hypothetical protein